MKSKVFLIIGKSFSGKNTLLNYILDDLEYCKINNIHKLVKYTTRLKRPGEIDGIDYHFIDNDYYEKEFKNNKNAITTSFLSEFGVLHYITDFSKLDESCNYIVDGDPESIQPYREILGDNLCVIWLMPPDWILFERFYKRNDNTEYSDKKYKEIQRRYVDDLIKFSKEANDFIANTTVIINLDEVVFTRFIKMCMIVFIHHKLESVIIGKHNTVMFDNHYIPRKDNTFTEEELLTGTIRFRNGTIIIDTNNKKVLVLENS